MKITWEQYKYLYNALKNARNEESNENVKQGRSIAIVILMNIDIDHSVAITKEDIEEVNKSQREKK